MKTDPSYYRARYYDQSLGRFLSEDPITFSGGIDFYAYVQNNPVEFTDVFGLQARPLPLPSPTPPAPSPGPVLVPTPEPAPASPSPCWICLIPILLNPQPTSSTSDFGPGHYHNNLLDYHSNQAIKKCAKNECSPCVPPVGTIAFRLDTTGRAHRGVPTPNWHLRVMQQNPINCQCQWVDIPDNQGGFGSGRPPAGTVPIGPPGGGGPIPSPIISHLEPGQKLPLSGSDDWKDAYEISFWRRNIEW